MMNWTNTLKMEPQDFNAGKLEHSLAKAQNVDLSNANIIVLTGEQLEVSADE
jgi:hypothetical protein